MTSVGSELIEALREEGRPRLVDAIRKLRDLLGNIDMGRVLELLKGLMTLLDDLGILPPATAKADDDVEIEAACAVVCAEGPGGQSTAQAIDLASLMAIVKLVIDLIRRLTRPTPTA